jgi:hypothetical protein
LSTCWFGVGGSSSRHPRAVSCDSVVRPAFQSGHVTPVASNFALSQFFDNLFDELEKANVPGVVRKIATHVCQIRVQRNGLPGEVAKRRNRSVLSHIASGIYRTRCPRFSSSFQLRPVLENTAWRSLGEWCPTDARGCRELQAALGLNHPPFGSDSRILPKTP